jgi:hypothetical protein
MNALASLLLNAAHAVAPKQDKLWIGDMRLEAPFVPNKLRFALAALGLAFKFRFAALKANRPVGIAFASAALAAVATLLFVPRLFGDEPATTAAMSPLPDAAYESVQDIAAERGYSAEAQVGVAPPGSVDTVVPEAGILQAQVPTGAAEATTLQEADEEASDLAQESLTRVSPPSEDAPAESTAAETPSPVAAAEPALEEPLAQEPLAAVPPPAAITVPETVQESNSGASVTTPLDLAVPDEETTVDSLEPANNAAAETETASATQAAPATLPTPATPDVDTEVISTQVKGESVAIEVQADALLTLYRNTDFSGVPRAHRYVTEGETFTANVPFSLHTDNAAAIQVTVDGERFSLGEDSEEQFRIFSKP